MFQVGMKVVSRMSFQQGKIGVLVERDPLGKISSTGYGYSPHWAVKWDSGGVAHLWEHDLKLLTPVEIKEEDFL